MLYIDDKHLKIIQNILEKYPYTFYAFGSRVKGNPRRFSDLDLCFFDNIPLGQLLKLEEEFEESDLPFKVDIIDWNNCDKDFQEMIRNDMVLLR